jgi:hypothetical protein
MHKPTIPPTNQTQMMMMMMMMIVVVVMTIMTMIIIQFVIINVLTHWPLGQLRKSAQET